MSLGLVYLIVTGVAVLCGFIDRKRATSKLSGVAAIVMIAGVAYAGTHYSWFHLLGLVGLTIVGINMFSAIETMKKRKAEEQERIDRVFSVDDDDENEE